MKNIILVLAVMWSAQSFANYDTKSFRTKSGSDIVEVGDTEEALFKKMGNTSKPRYFVDREQNNSCAATEYKYEIGSERYIVVLCYGKIKRISWERR